MNEHERNKNLEDPTGTVVAAAEMQSHPIDEVREHLKGVIAIHEGNLTKALHNNLKGTGVTLTGDQTPIAHEGIVDHSQFENPSGNTGGTKVWSNTQKRRAEEQEELERAA